MKIHHVNAQEKFYKFKLIIFSFIFIKYQKENQYNIILKLYFIFKDFKTQRINKKQKNIYYLQFLR